VICEPLLTLPRIPGAQVASSELGCDDASGFKQSMIDVLTCILSTNSSSRASAVRSVQLNISPAYGIPRVSVYISESIPSAAASLGKNVAELPASQRTYSSRIESACCLLQMRKGSSQKFSDSCLLSVGQKVYKNDCSALLGCSPRFGLVVEKMTPSSGRKQAMRPWTCRKRAKA